MFIPRIEGMPWHTFSETEIPYQPVVLNTLTTILQENKSLIIISCIAQLAYHIFSGPLLHIFSITTSVTLVTSLVKDFLQGHSITHFIENKAHELYEMYPSLPLLLTTCAIITSIFWPTSRAGIVIATLTGIISGLSYSTNMTRSVYEVRLRHRRDNIATFS